MSEEIKEANMWVEFFVTCPHCDHLKMENENFSGEVDCAGCGKKYRADLGYAI